MVLNYDTTKIMLLYIENEQNFNENTRLNAAIQLKNKIKFIYGVSIKCIS
jgi:hypothetical protein